MTTVSKTNDVVRGSMEKYNDAREMEAKAKVRKPRRQDWRAEAYAQLEEAYEIPEMDFEEFAWEQV